MATLCDLAHFHALHSANHRSTVVLNDTVTIRELILNVLATMGRENSSIWLLKPSLKYIADTNIVTNYLDQNLIERTNNEQ